MNKQWTRCQASRFTVSVRIQRRIVNRILLLLLLTIGMTISVASRAMAAPTAPTFTVNTTFDGTSPGACANNIVGGCSLREAIIEANHFPGAGVTINIPAGTYGLTIYPSGSDDETTGDLNVNVNMTITGSGAATTIIDGNQLDRVINVGNGITGMTATISNLTVRNGQTSSGGGGIYNSGTLTLNNSIITNNSTGDGGGGIFTGYALTVTNSIVNQNSSTNPSGFGGGGILVLDGNMTLIGSAVSNNISARGGGGILNDGNTTTILNSTISNNSAAADGGGIINSSSLSIVNASYTTIAGNLADNNATGAGVGGGIWNPISTVNLKDTLLGENYVGAGQGDCYGTINAQGYDIIEYQPAGCIVNLFGTGRLVAPILVDSLKNNGGPTPTRALFPSSAAMGMIPVGTDGCGTTINVDQRGFPRPTGSACDAGAYEGSLPNNLFGVNLIRNGDAEGAAGSPTGASVGFPYWNSVAGIVPYGVSGGFPTAANLVPPTDAGYNFFSGANFWPTTFIQQTISVQGISAAIDTGQVKYNLSGYFGGYLTQNDHADLVATFLDSNSSQISLSPFIGDVTAADRGNVTELLFRTASGVVPKGTRSIVFRLTMVNAGNNGTYTDGYADNLSLVLSPLPLYLPLIRR